MRRTLHGDGSMLAISTLLVAIVVSSAHGQRYLTIDSSVIETTNGLEISLGPVAKDPANPLFGENRPWEAAWWNTYPTVAYDASTSKFKMWYNSNTDCSCKRGLAAPCSACNTSNPGMCPHLDYANSTTAEQRVFGKTLLNGAITAVMYAESVDGRSWVKPSLGLVNFRGSTANNMVLLNPAIHSGAGVFIDTHDDKERRFKMFGILSGAAQPPGIVPRSETGMGNLVSADGIHWGGWKTAAMMIVSADTANNAVWDSHLKKYIAFSRNWCRSETCNKTAWGERRETRSTSDTWGGNWSRAVEVLHGEVGYEMYSLVPFRSPAWTPGLYLAIGSFYATTDAEGHVHCELCRSTDFGLTWERLAPHKEFIPLGSNGTFDSHTCYAAPPILDPKDPTNTSVLLYYAGGNGPHSGGGVEHGRANFIGLAHANTESLAGLSPRGSGIGALRTSPFLVSGNKLFLCLCTTPNTDLGNLSTTASVVHVRLLPIHGGFHGIDAGSMVALQGSAHPRADRVDATDLVDEVEVQWEGGSNKLLSLQGRSVQIELTIRGVVLFSFWFQ